MFSDDEIAPIQSNLNGSEGHIGARDGPEWAGTMHHTD
jgi:hypothetical protein